MRYLLLYSKLHTVMHAVISPYLIIIVCYSIPNGVIEIKRAD